MEHALYDSTVVSNHLFFPRWGRRTPGVSGALRIEIELVDGTELGAVWVRHLPGAPTLLLFHGDGENVCDQLELWPRRLQRLGLNGMFLDYPGYSLSQGPPSLGRARAGARAALAFLLKQKRAQVPAVVVLGRSLGSLFAIDLACHSRSPRLRGLVIESGLGDVEGWFRDSVPLEQLGERAEACVAEVLRDFDSVAQLRRCQRPVLVLHARDDSCVPVRHGERNAEAAGAQLWRAEFFAEGGHGLGCGEQEGPYLASLGEFVTAVCG